MNLWETRIELPLETEQQQKILFSVFSRVICAGQRWRKMLSIFRWNFGARTRCESTPHTSADENRKIISLGGDTFHSHVERLCACVFGSWLKILTTNISAKARVKEIHRLIYEMKGITYIGACVLWPPCCWWAGSTRRLCYKMFSKWNRTHFSPDNLKLTRKRCNRTHMYFHNHFGEPLQIFRLRFTPKCIQYLQSH